KYETNAGHYIRAHEARLDCRANVPDFQTDLSYCTSSCPSFHPIRLQIDLSSVQRRFDPEELKTDADIRQAILATLYKFHSEYPKRFGSFDVTPAYLLKAVGINEQTLARVILPMEENDE